MISNNITFHSLLEEMKRKNKSICIIIAEELTKAGFPISVRQIQKYKSGEVVPPAHIAKEILKICEINMDDSELLELITLSEKAKNSFSPRAINPNEMAIVNSTVLHKRITLRAKDFNFLEGSGIENDKSLVFIEDVISDEYGDDRDSFNRYIINLINEDMKK